MFQFQLQSGRSFTPLSHSGSGIVG